MVKDRIWLSLFRYLLRHHWQALLSITGIALSVAVVVAVDLANQSIRQSFASTVSQITGKTTHQILPITQGIEEQWYTHLKVDQGIELSAPVVEGLIEIADESFNLLGLDPLAELPFRSFVPLTGNGRTNGLMSRSNSVYLAAVTAERLGIKPGEKVPVKIADVEKQIVIAGLIGDSKDKFHDGILVADIATAQELLNRQGWLDRIDLILSPSEEEQLRSNLSSGLMLVAPENRHTATAELGRSFHSNLTAMSLLALLVGGFLIYNAVSFSVLQRRSLLAILRMLGVTRRQLFYRVLLETSIVGCIGTFLGILIGIGIGQGLVGLVARTINDLYYTSNVSALLIQPMPLIKGFLLGMFTALIAALAPAREAARTNPQSAVRRSYLEMRQSDTQIRLIVSSLVSAALGIFLIQLPGNALLPGLAGLFFVILAYCLVVPTLVRLLSRVFTPLLEKGFGFNGRYAGRGIVSSLSRTGLAISALTMAVAATIGMGTMVDSFRGTVTDWLDQSLKGDVYLSIPQSITRHIATELPVALFDELNNLEGIKQINRGRRIEIHADYGAVDLLALDIPPENRDDYRFKGSTLPNLWQQIFSGEALLISEPYAFHNNLKAGDHLNLTTPGGIVSLKVGGVFFDYASDRGVIILHRQTYARYWQDNGVSALGITFQKENSDTRLTAKIKSIARDYDTRIQTRSNRQIQQYTLDVFDRTFTITRVLRLLVILVAVVGILSALMALQFERARENALLRASGCTRLDLIKLTTLQTGTMGLFAGLLALPLGWLIGQVLIQVINLRSFGWTLQSEFSPGIYAEAVTLAILAALVAGLIPGLRMAGAVPAIALREE